jgi:hypothetical protein
MTFWEWFKSSFNHDYRDTPDFKKIMAFQICLVFCFISVWLVITTPGSEDLVVWCLSGVLAGILGFNIAPLFNKNASQVKSQEMQTYQPSPAPALAPVTQSVSLIERAKWVGLPETATEAEIVAAELKKKEDAI